MKSANSLDEFQDWDNEFFVLSSSSLTFLKCEIDRLGKTAEYLAEEMLAECGQWTACDGENEHEDRLSNVQYYFARLRETLDHIEKMGKFNKVQESVLASRYYHRPAAYPETNCVFEKIETSQK